MGERRKSPGTPGESVEITRPKMFIVDSEDSRVNFGTWTSTEDADAVGGTVLRNNNPGSYVSFAFKGAMLWIRFRFGSDAGKALIKIDGEEKFTVDFYNAQTLYKYVNVAVGLDPDQKHTLTVTISSTKNSSSSDYYVNIDAFAYRKSSSALTIHDIEFIDVINVINTINRIGEISMIVEVTDIKNIENIGNMPDPTPKGSEGIAFLQGAAGVGSWQDPTGFSDPGVAWHDEADAYDNNTSTYAYNTCRFESWSSFIYLTRAAVISNKIRFNARYDAIGQNKIDIDVLKDGVWVDVYEGDYDDNTTTEKDFTQGSVTQIRVRFYSSASSPTWYVQRLYEVDFWEVPATGGEMITQDTGVNTNPEQWLHDNNWGQREVTIAVAGAPGEQNLGAAVPAGETRRIRTVVIRHVGTNNTVVTLLVSGGAVSVSFDVAPQSTRVLSAEDGWEFVAAEQSAVQTSDVTGGSTYVSAIGNEK